MIGAWVYAKLLQYMGHRATKDYTCIFTCDNTSQGDLTMRQRVIRRPQNGTTRHMATSEWDNASRGDLRLTARHVATSEWDNTSDATSDFDNTLQVDLGKKIKINKKTDHENVK